MHKRIRWVFFVCYFLGRVFGFDLNPDEVRKHQSFQQQEITPILVTGMVHLDPLPLVEDTTIILDAYASHRDGWLWYLDLANATGVALSAQVTGVYAEACVRQGHAADFEGCMPGGPHHLGTHLHGNVKGDGPYFWSQVPDGTNHDPEMTQMVFSDNIPWINRIFEENGFSFRDNWFLHGSHMTFFGMDEVLFGQSDLPYQNTFDMAGGLRGRLVLYRGDFVAEPNMESGDFIKISEVGGIIGEDQDHGPEGMVHGSVPYQRRDFIRAYIEWRESVRLGHVGHVRHFTWMIHPYQLKEGYVGSGGRSARECIEELVAWLNDNFIGKTDESGSVMARYANAAEIRQEFEQWESRHPEEAADLQQSMETDQPPLYFPATRARLDTTYHVASVDTGTSSVIAHHFKDHDTGFDLFLAWSIDGDTHAAGTWMSGEIQALRADGTFENIPLEDVRIAPEPTLFECQPLTLSLPRVVHIPHIASSEDWQTELFVDNADTAACDLEIALYRDGVMQRISNAQVESGKTTRFLLEGGDCGTVAYGGHHILFKTLFTHKTERGMAEFALDGEGLNDLVFLLPHSLDDTITWQGLALANVSGHSAQVTLTAVDANDQVAATRELNVAAHDRWVGVVQDLFPDVQPSDLIRVHALASAQMAGIVISGNHNRSLLFTRAVSTRNSSDTLAIPHFAKPENGWLNTLIVDHVGNSDAQITVTFHGPDGEQSMLNWVIQSGSQIAIDVDELLDFSPITANIDLSSSALLVRQRFTRTGHHGMTEFFAGPGMASEVVFDVSNPLGEELNWNGFALCNPSSISGTVTLQAWSQGNVLAQERMVLDAHASVVSTLGAAFDVSPESIEKVSARADVPLAGLFMAGKDHDSYLFSSAWQLIPEVPEDSPFGFHPAQVTLPNYPDNGFADATNIGVSWTREGLYAFWFLIQKDLDRQEYDFFLNDNRWQGVPENMCILGNIAPQGPIDEGRCLDGSWIPIDREQYARFVEATVERYDGDGFDDMPGLQVPIMTWQVGNEPNHTVRTGFAELQRLTYQAVKQACPECRVMIGGATGFPDGYVQNFEKAYRPILQDLGGEAVDIFDFHWYGHAFGNYSMTDGITGEDVLDHLRQVLTQHGFSADLPVWITEMGSYSGAPATRRGSEHPPQTEREHARDLFKRFVYPLSRGVEKVFPAFGLAEGFKQDDGYFDHTGLIYDGRLSGDQGLGVKKLAYFTHKKMTQTLSGVDWNTCRHTRPDLLEQNICVFRAFKRGTPIFIAWLDPIDEQQDETFQTVALSMDDSDVHAVCITSMVPDHTLGIDVTDFDTAFSKEYVDVIEGMLTFELGFDPVVIECANGH